MNGSTPPSRRSLSARRLALLATTIVGFGAAAVLAPSMAPKADFLFADAAHAQNLSQEAQQLPQHPVGFADIVAKVKPAVISVRVKMERPVHSGLSNNDFPFPPGSPFEHFFRRFGMPNNGEGGGHQVITGQGSGFFITADGYAVTNNHVVQNAENVQVTTDDGKTHSAKVIGTDPRTDLALIKVDGNDFPYVKLADGAPRVGDWVLAVGNPFGLGETVTAGILSARNRNIDSGPYDDFLQTDASINKGNSGGPLFNLNSEVVGVNTAIISPSGGSIGIGFAVPSNSAVAVIDQLRQYGETRRGWLGVRIQQVTDDIAESLGIKPPRGALVAGVDDRGPAKPAGIEPGDVVVKFDGHDIKDMHDLPRVVADTPVGKQVEVVVIRKGKEETHSVKIGRLEDGEKMAAAEAGKNAAPEQKSVVQKTLGLELSSLSDDLRKKFKVRDNIKGVIVTGVDPNVASAAPDKRLSPGDVIVEVQYQSVGNPADLQTRLDALKAEGKKVAVLLVSNADGETRFVALSLQ